MDVIDVRKFRPAATYVGGRSLGPVEPEPEVEEGGVRSKPVKYYTLEEANLTARQHLVAQVLIQTMPPVAPARKNQGENEKSEKKLEANWCDRHTQLGFR